MQTGLIWMLIIMIAGCRQQESAKIPYEHLYFDYRVTADEGEDAACVLQFKWGGPEGEASAIRAPGYVQLDGEQIEADSAGFSGIYYEKYLPANEFTGKHSIQVTMPDKKIFREDFVFSPFGLEEIPEQVSRKAFVLRFTNFPNEKTRVRLQLIDTAFRNNDFVRMVDVTNSELKITDAMLGQLKSGPVTLEVYREQDLPIKNRTRAGGKLFMSYGLQRDFDLMEN